ncbi:MAG: hypothetical protein JOZ38_03275 [Candidatus Eremiobacteraeota bacterium]|nr:hypothetical protein [Candidatus Eremiobacteraeota bacterium]
MQDIIEFGRRESPAPRPQSLAFDGDWLWMGSIETERIYGIDPVHWSVREEHAAPGKPWGMAVVGNELRVICGEGSDDDRYIRRFVPGHGFKSGDAIACPDFTGSQLGFDGSRLWVSQWYNRKLLALDAHGTVEKTIDVPHGICGQVIVNGAFLLMTTDDEAGSDFFVTEVRDGKSRDVARVPLQARALAYDGRCFWTNHRERNEIVVFNLPTE